MDIVYKRVKDLIPYSKNPRKNDNAVDYVARSIEKFGFRVPIVIDGKDNVICGHTRLKACRKMGIDDVPCVVAADLTEEQIKAFRLADNKVSEMSQWDIGLLNEELDDITLDMSDFGFDTFSVDDFDEIDGYNESDDSRDCFTKTFTFPLEKKKQIVSYLKKHQNEIVDMIIKESDNVD